jgi:sugar phosphate isomerase/epimerase
VARRAGIWLAFHNEADHMKPIDGQVPYEVFVERLDPAVVRLQLDVGNMLMGGADPMRYYEKYRDRYWSFHLKDVLPDRSSDTELGRGTFDFKRFLAGVAAIEEKPCYVEQEGATDEVAAARKNWHYLNALDF